MASLRLLMIINETSEKKHGNGRLYPFFHPVYATAQVGIATVYLIEIPNYVFNSSVHVHEWNVTTIDYIYKL